MNTLENLIAAIHAAPEDLALRGGFYDYLTEHGNENDWQGAVDLFPTDSPLKTRFGQWLIDKEDVRGRGYWLLGTLRRIPITLAGQVHAYSKVLDESDLEKECRLPLSLFEAMPIEEPATSIEGAYFPDSEYWKHCKPRRALEDKVAITYSSLPPEEKEVLLRTCGIT